MCDLAIRVDHAVKAYAPQPHSPLTRLSAGGQASIAARPAALKQRLTPHAGATLEDVFLTLTRRPAPACPSQRPPVGSPDGVTKELT